MEEERMRVLEMVEDGKVSADEGVRLIEAISKRESERPSSTAGRCLRVRVFEGNATTPKVNVTVPLVIAKLALKFMPRSAVEQMEKQGIKLEDLSQMISSVEGAAPFRIADVEAEETKIEVFVE